MPTFPSLRAVGPSPAPIGLHNRFNLNPMVNATPMYTTPLPPRRTRAPRRRLPRISAAAPFKITNSKKIIKLPKPGKNGKADNNEIEENLEEILQDIKEDPQSKTEVNPSLNLLSMNSKKLNGFSLNEEEKEDDLVGTSRVLPQPLNLNQQSLTLNQIIQNLDSMTKLDEGKLRKLSIPVKHKANGKNETLKYNPIKDVDHYLETVKKNKDKFVSRTLAKPNVRKDSDKSETEGYMTRSKRAKHS